MTTRRISIALLLTLSCVAGSAVAADAETPAPPRDTLAVWTEALDFLAEAQKDDGSWGDIPGRVGVTAVVVEALARAPEAVRAEHGEQLDDLATAGAAYLVAMGKKEGGVFDVEKYANYCTSLAVTALCSLDRKKYADAIDPAVEWILSNQCVEARGYDPEKHRTYGGFGYGSSLRPDLSNTWIALNALHAAGLPDDHPAWKAAALFVSRCQNSPETNDQAYAGTDGGSMYLPGESPAGSCVTEDGKTVYNSYGSMTCAMLLAYHWCNVPADDPRAKLALDWLRKHYTLLRNPGTKQDGQQGRYYYYRVLAKCMDEYGDAVLPQATWREQLAGMLARLQQKDGSWSNAADRWSEGDPALVTGYCLSALAVSGIPVRDED